MADKKHLGEVMERIQQQWWIRWFQNIEFSDEAKKLMNNQDEYEQNEEILELEEKNANKEFAVKHSRFKIVGTNKNDAEFFLDGFELMYVKKVELSMTAGERPTVRIEMLLPRGVDIDLPGSLATVIYEESESENEISTNR